MSRTSEITVREPLDQTSGLADYTRQPALQRALGRSKLNALSDSDLIALIVHEPLEFKPGSKFEYSNTNYIVAGMIVETVSHESYATYVQRHIFNPLHLRTMQYLRTSIPNGTDVSYGYKLENGRAVELPIFTMSWAKAAGALAGNVRDLIMWDDGFFHGRVLSASSVRVMIAPSPVGEDYAMGWAVDRVNGKLMIWHNGGLPGVHAMNAVFPQTGYEVVVLTNLYAAKAEDVAKKIFAVLDARDMDHHGR